MDGRGCFGPLEAQEVRRGPNVPRSPPHSSWLRSFKPPETSAGARVRRPGTQPPWRPRTSTTSGWTPLPTCGAPEEAEGEGGRERGMEGGDEGSGRERGGESPATPQRHPGARGGDGRGRYGYTEATRTYTKAWPAEYDDLWEGIPVPHCRRHRRSSSSVGCFGRAVRYVGGAWPSRRASTS